MKAASSVKARRTRFEVLFNQEQIARRISELGAKISADYTGEEPVLVGVLRAGVVFLADLMRAISLPVEVEFVSAASYRQGTSQSEQVTLEGNITIPLKGRHVLVVEGVVDTGKTVSTIVEQIRRQEPASVAVVTLIDKPACHRTSVDIKYKGFSVGNDFVIGYGLDNAQKYRNLPYIGRVIEQQEG
ncbi:MAG: hypoxanthine phosphoribosyltransferase [Candidatus Zixiibacteriota bacterium]